jgi:hypothetical protein
MVTILALQTFSVILWYRCGAAHDSFDILSKEIILKKHRTIE